MQVVFRTDASLDIGTGHVMRCLTLAQALREQGEVCRFVTREHPGHLAALIQQRGFEVHLLDRPDAPVPPEGPAAVAHAAWLGTDAATDAQQTRAFLGDTVADWLVVDHYALDAQWERRLRPNARRLMVIDDLADRPHDADLLLDQNLGRQAADYAGLLPAACHLAIGPRHALLRPEFGALRARSLQRRSAEADLRHVLISLGGVDKNNLSAAVLATLDELGLPTGCRVTVVLGAQSPGLDTVRELAQRSRLQVEVVVNTARMADLMADADLAIGGAGTTAWERCCLGLPTLTLVMADNQLPGALALEAAGCVVLLRNGPELKADLICGLERLMVPALRGAMQSACQALADGLGVQRIAAMMTAPPSSGRVRPLTADDLATVLAWRNHSHVRQYMLTQHEISLAEHRAWFERVVNDPAKRALIFEEGGRPLGFVHFSGVAPDGVADWGFYTAPDAPKGTGSKLGQAALALAFDTLGLHKVCGQVLISNAASIAFHQRLGFRLEGNLREQHRSADHHEDILCFGILSHEWPPTMQAAQTKQTTYRT